MTRGTREARERVYQALNTPAVNTAATGGIAPAEIGGSLEERLAKGPHVLYYNVSWDRTGFRRYQHLVAVETIVPSTTYVWGGENIGPYEYAEILMQEIADALEPATAGEGGRLTVSSASYVPGDGFEMWQMLVTIPMTTR